MATGRTSETQSEAAVAPRLLSVKGLAAYLSCTVWAARTLLWAGEITFIQIGKKHLVDVRDADAFIERRKKEGR
jgi:hypothetical protein